MCSYGKPVYLKNFLHWKQMKCLFKKKRERKLYGNIKMLMNLLKNYLVQTLVKQKSLEK